MATKRRTKQEKNKFNIDKLLMIALATRFETEQLSNLIDIINATPIPNVTAEVLLSIYEEPVFTDHKNNSDSKSKANITFISYDKFTDQVLFSYKSITSKQGWFIKGQELIDDTTVVSTKWWEDDAARDIQITREELVGKYIQHPYNIEVKTEVLQDTCSSATWFSDKV